MTAKPRDQAYGQLFRISGVVSPSGRWQLVHYVPGMPHQRASGAVPWHRARVRRQTTHGGAGPRGQRAVAEAARLQSLRRRCRHRQPNLSSGELSYSPAPTDARPCLADGTPRNIAPLQFCRQSPSGLGRAHDLRACAFGRDEPGSRSRQAAGGNRGCARIAGAACWRMRLQPRLLHAQIVSTPSGLASVALPEERMPPPPSL